MKIYLDMVGCRLNQSEIEIMARQFSAAGHTLVGDPSEADLAVVNTCTVTAAAAADSRKTIRRIHRNGVERIISTGCWSSLQPEQALNLPGVTHVISNTEKSELVSILFPPEVDIFDQEPILRVTIPGNRQRTRAFIKAQDGCRHSCTFCITTIARGKSRSESLESVVGEINAAVQAGIKEAVLTGVQLGSWGKELNPSLGLHDLVQAVLDKTGIPRLRLSSIEPWDIHPSLIELMQEKRIARHLHLPLQSGSAETLRRMAREINPQTYKELVDQIRLKNPGIAITTDILTGFPGETDAEYREGLDFIRQMEFAAGHVFTYSAREGTRAADYPDQVPHPVRKKRSAEIRTILATDAERYRQGFLGKELVVLWEQVEERKNTAIGLTDNYLRVEAEAPVEVWNTFSRVKIQ
ncbi:MAG: tRNA (N(6)-L-threonylcarbamoyladenosine(37)-C(2))-methylthiotransferase MtaB, partial [Chloroflexi bacterium]|nr:tRNA (N(6)-L-threonylcarbamoyladenosine(37)-C(2))-methylthiotransferase MtaB [Chloroflexota bacterium]